jgi:hypothetical protein
MAVWSLYILCFSSIIESECCKLGTNGDKEITIPTLFAVD